MGQINFVKSSLIIILTCLEQLNFVNVSKKGGEEKNSTNICFISEYMIIQYMYYSYFIISYMYSI